MPTITSIINAYDENFLVGYLDLCGTSALYRSGLPVKQVADRIVASLFEPFLRSVIDSFSEKEISEDLYIHIFADSILICPRTKEIELQLPKLLSFVMDFFKELIFNSYLDDEIPVAFPCRAIILRGPMFCLNPRKDGLFQGSFINLSLCGGRVVIDADGMLKGLPVGLYLSADVCHDSDLDSTRLVSVQSREMVFVKFPMDDMLNLTDGRKLDEFIDSRLRETNNSVKLKMWQPWIEANLGSLDQIIPNIHRAGQDESSEKEDL